MSKQKTLSVMRKLLESNYKEENELSRLYLSRQFSCALIEYYEQIFQRKRLEGTQMAGIHPRFESHWKIVGICETTITKTDSVFGEKKK